MSITDFHVHAGAFESLRDDIQGLITKRPMEPGVRVEEVFSTPSLLESYLSANGVGQTVLIAECGPGTNFSIDSEMIAHFCKGRPMFIPFGSLNPNFHSIPTEFEKSIRLGMRGFKLYPADHDFDPFIPEMMLVYQECERLRLPVMFHTGLTAQRDAKQRNIAPREFAPLVERFPDLLLILAHAGKPHWFADAADMAKRYPNLYLDTALVEPATLTTDLFADDSVLAKVLFGSDWPVCGGYSGVLDRYKAALPMQVQQAVFTDNPRRVIAKIGA